MVNLKYTNNEGEMKTYNSLRKEFLNIKGNLILKLELIELSNNGNKIKKRKTIIGSSGFVSLKNKIDIRRAVFNAVTNAFYKAQFEYKMSSSVKVNKLIDWGVKYGNNEVKIKRFKRKGKYYTGVWVKGSKGIKSINKWSPSSKKNINNYIGENNLFSQSNNVWSNDF